VSTAAAAAPPDAAKTSVLLEDGEAGAGDREGESQGADAYEPTGGFSMPAGGTRKVEFIRGKLVPTCILVCVGHQC